MNEQPDMSGWGEIGAAFLAFVVLIALGNGVGVLLTRALAGLPEFVARLLSALF